MKPFLWAFLTLLWLVDVVVAAPCTHYASPTGSGTVCTEESPCRIASLWDVLTPGEEACLVDGTYTASDSVIDPPDGFSGTASQPITVRAENDGLAIIDGGGTRRPVNLHDNYWLIIAGIDARNCGDYCYSIAFGSDNNILRRVVARGTALSNGENNFRLSGYPSVGVNNLCEDCAGFGRARKCATGAQNTSGGIFGSATFRRMFCLWEEKTNIASNPKHTYEITYNSGNTTYENVIGSWRSSACESPCSEPEGVMTNTRKTIFGQPIDLNTHILGSIFYLLGSYIFEAPRLMSAGQSSDDGSIEKRSYDGLLVRDTVVYIEPGTHTTRQAWSFGNPAQTAQNLRLDNIVGVNTAANFVGSQWQQTNVRQGADLTAAGVVNIWNELPGLCHRIVNRAQTTVPLWPWPMNQRIKDAMAAEGRIPIDVTSTMETLFGAIPVSCGGQSDIPAPVTSLRIIHP